ncbi:MAG: UDP-N-acetylmuramoyl-L-alanyl-D-glutamate--2,6-diaminopimelate ligase [Pauljensenia sp.]
MTSVADIRPHVTPMPLSRALQDVDVLEWMPRGTPGPPPQSTPVCGVTVSNHDVAEGWIFVAVPGLTQHGIRFAHAAAEGGATAVLTDPEGARLARELDLDLPVVVVAEPRAVTPLVAATVYGHPAEHLTTMAVTGTNGKTTTTYLMRAALTVAHPDPALCGTVETLVGGLRILSERTTNEAPVVERLLALAVEEGLGAAVVETSAHALSLNRVDGIVFDVAGFTNLQHDHLDYYGDMEHYYEAKRLLFTPAHSRQGVVCVDDEWGRRLAEEAEVPVTTVSALTDTPAQWTVRGIHPDLSTSRTVFTLVDPTGTGHEVACPIPGEVNVQNTVVAIVSAVQLGLDLDAVIHAVEHAGQVPGRMEKVNTAAEVQPLVVVDYAHTSEGLEWTLRSIRELTRGRVVLVFGTDGDRDASKREDVAEVAARGADVLWVTDENPRTEDAQSIRDQLLAGIAHVRPGLEEVTEVTTCRRDAVRRAILAAQPGDTVIITGKGAEWYQEVQGIDHAYNDVPVAREVLAQDPRIQAL